MGEGKNADRIDLEDAQLREGYKLWVERGRREAWRD